MNKQIFLIIILLVISSLPFSKTFAQDEGFKAGPFFNANGIHFEGDNKIFWQSPNGQVWGGGGLSGGLFVRKNISEKIHLRFELRYIQKGSVFEYGNEFGNRSVETIRLNYAEIPFLIAYSFKINNKIFIAETGLGYAKTISKNLHLNELTSQNEISNIDAFREDDLSWISGFKFPLNEKKKNNLLLGFRFSYSLKSIHNYYNLRNMVYGVQLDYLVNKN